MNYPSLSLKQDLIDKVFSNKKNGVQKELNQTPSPGSIRLKQYYKKQKELRLQNVVVDECDKCDYKTTRFQALTKHKREKHTGVKQKCTNCDYSHVYPSRVKWHYNQVHMTQCKMEVRIWSGKTHILKWSKT